MPLRPPGETDQPKRESGSDVFAMVSTIPRTKLAPDTWIPDRILIDLDIHPDYHHEKCR